MAKSKELSIDSLKPLAKLLKRFHLILFFVFIVACLAGAIMLINNTVQQSSADSNYTSSITAGSIDQKTLNNLKALHTSTEASPPPTLPPGRVNPVSE